MHNTLSSQYGLLAVTNKNCAKTCKGRTYDTRDRTSLGDFNTNLLSVRLYKLAIECRIDLLCI